VEGRSSPARLGIGWAIAAWIALAAVVGFTVWPWIPHTTIGVIGILVLGPPLFVLAEFAGDRYMKSRPVRAAAAPRSVLLRIALGVVVVGAPMLALCGLWLWLAGPP
jgi:hypothetical protein